MNKANRFRYGYLSVKGQAPDYLTHSVKKNITRQIRQRILQNLTCEALGRAITDVTPVY